MKKAIGRARNAHVDLTSNFDVVVFLEKEIDRYREKIKQLEAVQDNTVGEIIKALSDNGFNSISINIYKSKEE